MGRQISRSFENVRSDRPFYVTKLRDEVKQELAAKITAVIIDRIVADIIRPGPKPEERECYVMAEELRELSPELEALARQVIDVSKD